MADIQQGPSGHGLRGYESPSIRWRVPLLEEVENRPYEIDTRCPYADLLVALCNELILKQPSSQEEEEELTKQWGENAPISAESWGRPKYQAATLHKAVSGPLWLQNWCRSDSTSMWVMGQDMGEVYTRLYDAGYFPYEGYHARQAEERDRRTCLQEIEDMARRELPPQIVEEVNLPLVRLVASYGGDEFVQALAWGHNILDQCGIEKGPELVKGIFYLSEKRFDSISWIKAKTAFIQSFRGNESAELVVLCKMLLLGASLDTDAEIRQLYRDAQRHFLRHLDAKLFAQPLRDFDALVAKMTAQR